MTRKSLSFLVRIAGAVLLSLSLGSAALPARAASVVVYDFVHDPSMIREGTTYYLYSTGDLNYGEGNIQIRTSHDLRTWDYRGTVFAHIPDWLTSVNLAITNLWAPDISYFHGQYQLYYAGSSFGSRDSAIGLATNATLDPTSKNYRWVDHGMVLQSSEDVDWNAIDPSFALDRAGKPWLVFGSFWTGIKLVALNPSTRKPASTHPTPLALAFRPDTNAVEAPTITYRAPYFYLFVSFDRCCNGVDSTYRIMVGRSKSITGPYLDKSGTAMTDGGGTQILASSGYVRGPGGQSILHLGSRYLMVFHFYDARDDGNPHVRIRQLDWSRDGWPMVGTVLSS